MNVLQTFSSEFVAFNNEICGLKNLLHYGCYWIRANLVLVEFWRKEGKKSNIPRTAPFRAHFRARQQQAAHSSSGKSRPYTTVYSMLYNLIN